MFRRVRFGIAILLALGTAFAVLCGAGAPERADRGTAAVAAEVPLDCPAKFVVSLASDLCGNVWIGTEDEGCWRYTPAPEGKGEWMQFTGRDLGGDDSVYAIGVDKLNRVWCGTLRHGVSVYNGQKWQSYSIVADAASGALAGPLGARVFAIATSPVDGDVWVSTEGGLARYSLKGDRWSYLTRASGLPSDQIASLAFSKAGDLFIGTQCDGVGIARASDGYRKWTVVEGPDRMPAVPMGAGLFSRFLF